MKLSVVIPVFNEEKTIAEVIRRVTAQSAPGLSLEVIVVDDGSTDGTRACLQDLPANDLLVLHHETNRGKGAAINTGLTKATGDAVIIQDADLEYDPADYHRIVETLGGGARVVYGSRIRGANPHSYLRYYYGGRFLTGVFNAIYGTRLTDVTTCYKAFRREAIETLSLKGPRFEFCVEVTARLVKRGESIVEVPITYHPRSMKEGKKIRWHDAMRLLWTMLYCRFTP